MAKKKRGASVARKSPKRTRRVRRAGGAGGRVRPAGMTSALQGLEQYRKTLLAQRLDIDTQLKAVEDALRAMGAAGSMAAAAAPALRGRPAGRAAGGAKAPRSGSLKEYILAVLQGGGEQAVKDITDGVLKAGYRTKNRTLAKSVGIALAEMDGKHVVKIGRGRFRLR